jgi:ketosteroid isomerase-like protein
MRRTRWLLFVMLLAVSASASADAQTAKQRIAALEDQWIQAAIHRDAAAFERLLHRAFVYTEDDRLYTRAQLIKEMSTGSDTVTSGRNEDMVVRVEGDVGIVTGWLVLVGRSGGRPFTRRYRYTDTWVKDSGRWRVLAAQDYLKP